MSARSSRPGPRSIRSVFRASVWYSGAAFQNQDDLLNLTGEFAKYGKELGGDIAEGKRTLMLIHLLAACTAREACTDALSREALRKAVAAEIAEVYAQMVDYGSIE